MQKINYQNYQMTVENGDKSRQAIVNLTVIAPEDEAEALGSQVAGVIQQTEPSIKAIIG